MGIADSGAGHTSLDYRGAECLDMDFQLAEEITLLFKLEAIAQAWTVLIAEREGNRCPVYLEEEFAR